ncbi:hypothetical protein F5Y12DRAFT_722938 [Xylaria sp. FL1777]|nr:hypothetical protein F5Y12DRAFT_722938 [Xylaria sp. FL1777]
MLATQDHTAMLGVSITFLLLDILVVGIRFYRVRMQKSPYEIDDWLVLPALALNIGMSIAVWFGVARHAVGYPTPPLTQAPVTVRTPLDQVNATISTNNEVFFIVSSMFAASVSLSKASILCFYRRIFCLRGLWRDLTMISITFMLVIVAMFGIGITFAFIFACGTHFEYYWSTAGAELLEKCINTQKLVYAQSVSDFIIDAIIILMPIAMVWKLHMKVQRKLAVIAIFLTASLAVIASLIKLVWFLWENETPWNPANDQDLIDSTFIFWSILETHVGLLAVCLPTLRLKLNNNWSLGLIMSNVRSMMSLSSLRTTKGKDGRSSTSESRGGSDDLSRV